MTEELLTCPFCNKTDMLREMDECDDILVDCQRCEASAWKDIWQSRAQPREQVTPLAPQSGEAALKYKRVDLGLKREMRNPVEQGGKSNDWYQNGYDVGYNRAIDDIKSKYGDLYVEAKSRFSDEVVEVK